MNVKLSLDSNAISQLIDRLEFFKDHIGEELVNILCIEGADEANIAYGSMASATGGVEEASESSTIGKIIASSDNGDKLLIAEFGAGDATLDPTTQFEKSPPVPVYPGSYSLLEGTGEYYLSRLEWGGTGIWHWNGIPYSAIPPRQGLFNAKQYVLQNFRRLAEEVIRFD